MSSANKKIQVLSDFEHILKRPTIYVGSVKLSEEALPIVKEDRICSVPYQISVGMYKLFDEVFSNCVDEAKRMKKPMDSITIDVDSKSNKIRIADTGDGFMDGSKLNEKSGLPNIETAVSMLRAGSNFDNDQISETLIGTNGMGVSLVNALSSYFSIESNNTKESYFQEWDNFKGSKPVIVKKSKNKLGTAVSFCPIADIFDNCKWSRDILYSMLLLKKRVLETESNTKSIKIKLIWDGKETDIKTDILKQLAYKTPIGEILIWEKTEDSGSISFVNSAICSGIQQKIIMDQINTVLNDSLAHHFYDFCLILNLPPALVKFGDQNKTKFVSRREDVEKIILDAFETPLKRFFNTPLFKRIKDLVERRKKETDLKKIRKEKKNVNIKFSHKYFPPTSRIAENLFIVEGLCIDENEKISAWREGELIHTTLKDVLVGDEVVTHANRIRKIVNKQRKLKECVTIKLSDGIVIKQPITHQYYTYDKMLKVFSFKKVSEIDIKRDSLVKSNLGNFIGNLEVVDFFKCEDEQYPNVIFLEDGSWYQFSDTHKYCVYDTKSKEFKMELGNSIIVGGLICVFDF